MKIIKVSVSKDGCKNSIFRTKNTYHRLIADFWYKVANNKVQTEEQKIKELKRMSKKVIKELSPKTLNFLRRNFGKSKRKPYLYNKFCWVCNCLASLRHHIILLKNGGRNQRRNIVLLCKKCHKKVHPFLTAYS